jgi:hypothetical protein
MDRSEDGTAQLNTDHLIRNAVCAREELIQLAPYGESPWLSIEIEVSLRINQLLLYVSMLLCLSMFREYF